MGCSAGCVAPTPCSKLGWKPRPCWLFSLRGLKHSDGSVRVEGRVTRAAETVCAISRPGLLSGEPASCDGILLDSLEVKLASYK